MDSSPTHPPGLVLGSFVERPNRFLAVAVLKGKRVRCHMPNLGRMKELLIPGVPLLLEDRRGENRRTDYSRRGPANRQRIKVQHKPNPAKWTALLCSRPRQETLQIFWNTQKKCDHNPPTKKTAKPKKPLPKKARNKGGLNHATTDTWIQEPRWYFDRTQ